ncbi:RAB11-binding protein RELCH homolog isoform X2 [Ptychodera flava]|uniref:RAB11-binding protein RELCH homolog isoform X2 n=1 Tax=Ptychodera flava TaxID=63121 RepID=UPI00396A3396
MADDYNNPFLSDIEQIEDSITEIADSIPEDRVESVTKTTEAHDELVSLDQVATKLLKDHFILTALELHTELVESGRELPRLRDYFSNPGNFERQEKDSSPQLHRTSSEQTFDSLDFARYSDDGAGQTDERVAVLEFELRKAKETIKSLRANLTEAAESEAASPAHSDSKRPMSPTDDVVKPHEKRAVNFLVNEYLLLNNYKLTSITFSDEVDDQDFEDWDDVGLNIPKPPDILHLYRDFGSHAVPIKDTAEVGCGDDTIEIEQAEETEADQGTQDEERIKLEMQLNELNNVITQLQQDNEELKTQVHNLQRDLAVQRTMKTSTPMVSPITTPRKAQVGNTATERPGVQPERKPPIGQDAVTDNGNDSNLTNQQADDSIQEEAKSQVTQNINSMDVTVGSEAPETVTFDVTDSGQDGVTEEITEESKHSCEPCRNNMSSAFKKALLDSPYSQSLDNRLTVEVSKIAESNENVVLMLARSLPHIVPNVLLAKREELIPLILCTVSLHPDPKERDNLLNILFNLIKKPDEEQRHMILTGCVAFAQHVGPTRVETELLPQCWEQISHKYAERRLLVAESCGVLAPYLPREIRSSLVLSMLQQMLFDEKTDMVREAVVKSLGIITAYIDDTDKYTQGCELLLTALRDSSDMVVNAAQTVYLPSFAMWAYELDKLESDLCALFVKKIEQCVKDTSAVASATVDESRINLLVGALQCLVPFLYTSVLLSAPFIDKVDRSAADITPLEITRFPKPSSPLLDMSTIIGDKRLLAAVVPAFEEHLDNGEYQTWDKFNWVVNEFIPRLLEVLDSSDVCHPKSIHIFSKFFFNLCRTFGRTFTETKVKPKFQAVLNVPEDQIDTLVISGQTSLTKATVPVYATGVLTCYNREEDRKQLSTFLQDVITTLSLCHTPLDSVKAAFTELHTNPIYHELLMTVLWNGVVHTSALVRAASARMFELLVKGVNETLVSTRVVPALITLSGDPEISVRIATIPAFGTILENTTQKEMLDRVYVQFQSFLDDPQYKDQHSLTVELIKTFGRVGPNSEPKFRDDFVLPRLTAIAHANNNTTNDTKKSDIALQLFEAYSALSCCFISDDLIRECLLPGLRCLRQDLEQVAPEHEEVVNSMIKDYETKIDGRPANMERSSSVSSVGSHGSAQPEDAKSKFFNKLGALKDKSSASRTKVATMFARKK